MCALNNELQTDSRLYAAFVLLADAQNMTEKTLPPRCGFTGL